MKRLKNNLLVVLSSASFLANASNLIPISQNQILIDHEESLSTKCAVQTELIKVMANNKYECDPLNWENKEFSLLTFSNNIFEGLEKYINCLPEQLIELINNSSFKNFDLDELKINEEKLKVLTVDLNDLLDKGHDVKKYILSELNNNGILEEQVNPLLARKAWLDPITGGFYETKSYYFSMPCRPQVKSELRKYNNYLMQLIKQRAKFLVK